MSYYQVVAYYTAKAAAAPAPVKPARVRRARYPVGHEKAGQFVPNDPSTEVNEAWVKQ